MMKARDQPKRLAPVLPRSGWLRLEGLQLVAEQSRDCAGEIIGLGCPAIFGMHV